MVASIPHSLILLARLAGLEPATYGLEVKIPSKVR